MGKVKCVYCFGEFEAHEADFRASSQIFQKNVKLDDYGVIENPVDEKHKHFLINFNIYKADQAENIAKKPMAFSHNINYEGVAYEEVIDPVTGIKYRKRILFNPEVWNTARYESNIRLCPHCHSELTPGFGLRKSLRISMVGDTNAGKTVFLTTLLSHITKDKVFDASLNATSARTALGDRIYQYNEEIYKYRKLPDATDKEKYIEPVLYTYTYNFIDNRGELQKNSIDIALYDIAGEDCAGQRAFEKVGENIKYSDGIIFMLNPMDIDIISERVKELHPMIIKGDLGYNRQRIIINNLYNFFMGEFGGLCDIPIAVVISKADVLNYEGVNTNYFNNHPHNQVFAMKNYENKNKGYIETNDFKNLQDDVLMFLEDFDARNFVNDARNHFKKTAFFSVSSINQVPVQDENDGKFKLADPISPYRVTDPFYWILHTHGLINMFYEHEVNGGLEGQEPAVKARPKPKKKKVFRLFSRE